MLDRRQFLKNSSLIALSATAPGFIARTARAAAAGKESVLVVLEMTGGNDGLNTVVPFGDDLYHKARPTIRLTKDRLVRVDDDIGLNPGLRAWERLLWDGQVAIVQGVGYPNPDRSHFESMDVWQSADPKRQLRSGWLGRGLGGMTFGPGAVPGAHIGSEQFPLALSGAATGVPSVHPDRPYDLEFGTGPVGDRYISRRSLRFNNVGMPAVGADGPHEKARRQLIEELAALPQGPAGNLLPFVQRTQLQTYINVARLRKILENSLRADRSGNQFVNGQGGDLGRNLNLVAQMINADFGTRVFYLSIGGFDTHAGQLPQHEQLLQQVAGSVAAFFEQLKQGGNAGRVLLMTFSEFGRRVQENGSGGTDHGAGSCLFVVGPGVRGGLIGQHPSLAELENGDLKHHTDFRRVYATLLDGWLGCDSRVVLGGRFEPVQFLKKL
jgi:uncharacterized protein (DUF1501 family)